MGLFGQDDRWEEAERRLGREWDATNDKEALARQYGVPSDYLADIVFGRVIADPETRDRISGVFKERGPVRL